MNIATNVTQLGVPNLRIINGKAPSVLSKLPPPDAIFIGGGITTKGMLTKGWASLKTGGCLVANVMTIEGEAIVSKHQKKLGGDLTRISISNLYNIGSKQAWRPSIPITQWKVQKPIPSARRHR